MRILLILRSSAIIIEVSERGLIRNNLVSKFNNSVIKLEKLLEHLL